MAAKRCLVSVCLALMVVALPGSVGVAPSQAPPGVAPPTVSPAPADTSPLSPSSPATGTLAGQPRPLPDLVVTDFWRQGEQVCYQVWNRGTSPAPRGHDTALFVDGALVVRDRVVENLPAGERWKNCVNHARTCEKSSETLVVHADQGGVVTESDESNNRRQETWQCDTTQPRIVGEPRVTASQTEATVRWNTDEDSDSALEYGQPAGLYPDLASDAGRVREHLLTLGGLQPGTTYHFRVRSTDASGNAARSDDRTFTTRPAPDKEAPRVALVQPARYSGRVEISARATDNTRVEKVEFLLDDVIVFTAYAEPFNFHLDTRRFRDGEHRLKLHATDPAGNTSDTAYPVHFLNPVDAAPPQLTIVSPAPGTTVGGKVLIKARATDDIGVLDARLHVDGTYYENMGWSSAPQADITFEMDWDTAKEAETSHHLELTVYDTALKTATVAIDLNVSHPLPPPPEPDPPALKVIARSVTRFGNYLDVSILVKNTGGQPASGIEILDLVHGFQVVSRTYASLGTKVQGRWDLNAREGAVEIYDSNPLPPGKQVNYGFQLVPVLAHPNPKTPEIGTTTWLRWNATGGQASSMVKQPVYKTSGGETIAQAHAAAVKTANYLIVTNPIRLILLNCPAYNSQFGTAPCWHDTNTVLSTMAELAIAKQGVLGYFQGNNTPTELRDLIRTGWLWLPPLMPGLPGTTVPGGPPGAWAQQLHPSFTTPGSGWLLIVGEQQIVPAWTISGTGVPTHEDGSDYIRQSDYRYADTTGEDQPQLIVGRIIGDSPKDLTRGLRASLGVHHNWAGYGNDLSHALALSGAGEFVDDFVNSVNHMADHLGAKGTSASVIHEKYTGGVQAVLEFQTLAPSRDFILLDGHGLPSSVGPLDLVNLPGTDFHGTNPVIWSEACLAGNYDYLTETTPAPANGTISEFFFELGAGGYFGSTEIGSMTVGKAATGYVADNWNPSTPLASQFYALKAWFASALAWIAPKYRGFLYEFNYYGDPKLGKSSLGAAPPSAPAQPASVRLGRPTPVPASDPAVPSALAEQTLDITLPGVDFRRSEGFHRVLLTGGLPLAEVGRPDVPAYPVSITYPLGTVVQGVRLLTRGGLKEGTGLNVAPVVDGRNGPAAAPAPPRPQPPSRDEGEWYPADTFHWRTTLNADGSTTLSILLYPFCYSRLTTDYRFYQAYQFTVQTARATAALVGLSTDRPAYRSGQPVTVTAEVLNQGTPRDLVLSVAVRDLRGGLAVGGLPVRRLTGLAGHAAQVQTWAPEGLAAGEYVVEAELREPDGTLLDRKREHLRLGVREAEVQEVTATPAVFEPGQSVSVGMTVRNTGSLPITGTAVLRVIDTQGATVARFTQPVLGLQPASVAQLLGQWNTAGVARGDYTAVGYLLLDSTATDWQTASISTTRERGPGL